MYVRIEDLLKTLYNQQHAFLLAQQMHAKDNLITLCNFKWNANY